jgi:hypothetical protein
VPQALQGMLTDDADVPGRQSKFLTDIAGRLLGVKRQHQHGAIALFELAQAGLQPIEIAGDGEVGGWGGAAPGTTLRTAEPPPFGARQLTRGSEGGGENEGSDPFGLAHRTAAQLLHRQQHHLTHEIAGTVLVAQMAQTVEMDPGAKPPLQFTLLPRRRAGWPTGNRLGQIVVGEAGRAVDVGGNHQRTVSLRRRRGQAGRPIGVQIPPVSRRRGYNLAMVDNPMKSSFELAMERLKKKDVEEGVVARPLSDAERAAIAEVRNFYDAKIAEQDVLHQSAMRQSVDPAERDLLDQQFRRDRERFSSERDNKVEKIRRGDKP